jgi:hypothetical protein
MCRSRYGEVTPNRSTPGLPFLGLHNTAAGCEAACGELSNCTQYSWSLDVPSYERSCFGRCDDIWKLHAVPSQWTVLAARRVVAGGGHARFGSTSSQSSDAPTVRFRYGCKRNATDQFGTVVQFPWPVCIPLESTVNMNKSWPNWGPTEGDFPTLQDCKRSGCT